LNQSLHFFEQLLLAQMRHFVAVQINVDQWYRRHMKDFYRNYTQVKEDEVAKLAAELDPDEIIDRETRN
uniref:Protein CASP n=1 Tax=Gongylonema pulchrum TaxID=637853 RepID=A0A183DIN2_9BILA